MASRATSEGKELLAAADALLLAHPELVTLGQSSWRGGFAAGAAWMQSALRVLGHETPSLKSGRVYHVAGTAKYIAATLAGSSPLLLALSIAPACSELACTLLFVVAIVGAVLCFYAVEAQTVFLFPILLEQEPSPFRHSILLTQKAGGTVSAMRRILPIALRMLSGGFVGKGFLRSWLSGCLAVLLWYRQVQDA